MKDDTLRAALAAYPRCTKTLRAEGKAYPRTCQECGLGPCKVATPQPAALTAPAASAAEAEQRFDCGECPTSLGCLRKCMKGFAATPQPASTAAQASPAPAAPVAEARKMPASQNVVDAVAEIGSECYRECDRLRREVESLRAALAAAGSAEPAERCIACGSFLPMHEAWCPLLPEKAQPATQEAGPVAHAHVYGDTNSFNDNDEVKRGILKPHSALRSCIKRMAAEEEAAQKKLAEERQSIAG